MITVASHENAHQLINERNEHFKSRKRLLKKNTHKRFISHQKLQKGQEHLARSGNLIPGKNFEAQTIYCCKLNCQLKIDDVEQRAIFKTYYNLKNWTLKTLFIRSHVEQNAVRQKFAGLNPIIPLKDRRFTYHYFLEDSANVKHKVCVNFFCKCIKINTNRVYRAINSAQTNPIAKDLRGNGPPKNKTNQRDKQIVMDFISQYPRYESHYGRSNSEKEYLGPDQSIRKMYESYVTSAEFRRQNVLSEHKFREIFNTKFNLQFKPPKIDTCKTCDSLKINIDSNALSSEEKQKNKELLEQHHQKVTERKNEFLEDVEAAKQSNGKTVCYTFDLQQVLPTPCISANVAYYKRQLATLNLCVFDEVNQKGYMYMWNEHDAARGADEIGSCLMRHLSTFVPESAENVILYSDSCGGQNRNIKVAMLLKKILDSMESVNTITHKFFTSGHSYNSCDRCFGIIEKSKKKTESVYSPEHWENVIRSAKKNDPKFEVIHMGPNYFYDSKNLLNLITNRKNSTNKTKINWFSIYSIKHIKNQPFRLFIKQKNDDNDDASLELTVNIEKKSVSRECFTGLELQNSVVKKISKKKYDDLIFLLQFLPNDYHSFYENLTHDADVDE